MADGDDDDSFYWEWMGCPPPEPPAAKASDPPLAKRLLPSRSAAPPEAAAPTCRPISFGPGGASAPPSLDMVAAAKPSVPAPAVSAPVSDAVVRAAEPPRARKPVDQRTVGKNYASANQLSDLIGGKPSVPESANSVRESLLRRCLPDPEPEPVVAKLSAPVSVISAPASGATVRPSEPPRARKPDEAPRARKNPASDDPLDKVFERLAEMQIVLAVPTVSALRAARPLRRGADEIYASQFVLQTAHRNFSAYLNSEDGQAEFHPHIVAGEDGSFTTLDDGTPVIYQTNGIARTTEQLTTRSVKCDKTGAPGHYMETKMLVARLRVKGKQSSTLQGARSMRTRQSVEDNLFYSFTSSWLIVACTGTVGELSEEDTGERIFIRRAVKDFTQHHFHDFPVAKSLANLIDDENKVLTKAFCLETADSLATTLFDYQCYTLRAWQTYEFDDKPPAEDVGVMLVAAARIGHVNELHRLVTQCGCDPDTMIAEFGLFGAGRTDCITRSSNAFAEERTALIAAVEAGWLSAVQAIIGYAASGRANLNVVCFDWTPDGPGGAGLRDGQTALDRARLYHYSEIESELLIAGGRSAKERREKTERRENPFAARQKQDKGENDNRGWQQREHKNRYADFSFVEFGEDLKMDAEMQGIVDSLQKELTEMGESGNSEGEQRTQFRKLAARWHPDKHPDEKKGLATRVFQWIQRVKDKGREGKAYA